MTDIIQYKEFTASVHYSALDEVFYGKLEGITDLVSFEGNTVKSLKNVFHEDVNDYIELCKSAGKDPFKSFKGTFNVRIKPELHSKAFEKATLSGKTLNQFVQEAIEKQL